jgi:ATP-dependent Lon protease
VRRGCSHDGEITLREEVLPIGGVKEKLLAAHRAGIRDHPATLITKKTLRRPVEISPILRFTSSKTMDEVLKIALRGRLVPLEEIVVRNRLPALH